MSRVSRGDVSDIKGHMKMNNIYVNDIEKTSHPHAKFSSYKIVIPVSGSDQVFDESFWPIGVRCQKWYNRTYRNYDSDSDNSDDLDDNDAMNNMNYNYNGSGNPYNHLSS